MLPLPLIFSTLILLLGAGAAARFSLSKRFDITCLPSTESTFPVDDCNDALKLMENSPKLAAYEPAWYGFLPNLPNALFIPLLGARGTNDAGDRFTIPRTYSFGQCSIGLNFITQYSPRDGSPLPNRPDHDFVDMIRVAAKEVITECVEGMNQGGGTTAGVEHRIRVVVWKTEGPSGKEMRRINSMRALVDCPFVNSKPVREGSVESCISGDTPTGESSCTWSGGSIDTRYTYSQTYCTATDSHNCCGPQYCRPVAEDENQGASMMQMMFGMKPGKPGPGWAETVGMCLMSSVASLGSSLTPREDVGFG
ncbi:MAG: hypothetical protein M1835_007378 [Candelina submexicana]|nr:MAG: hypothetical protein M1835_007378 [Candelina submexicana]